MPVTGKSVALTAAGGILLWSGISGTSLSTAFRDLLSGQELTQDQEPIGTAAAASGSTGSGGSAAPGNTGADTAVALANQAIGRIQSAAYGWAAGAQWDDLVSLWNQESGWSNTAQNAESGAYGIPQALPYTKMPQSAWPSADGGESDPVTQIQWGLEYIKSAYGSPSAAWAHEVSDGWY